MPLYGNETIIQNMTNLYDMFTVAHTLSGGILFPLTMLVIFIIVTVNLRNHGIVNSAFAGMVLVFILTTLFGIPTGMVSADFWNIIVVITALLGIIIISTTYRD